MADQAAEKKPEPMEAPDAANEDAPRRPSGLLALAKAGAFVSIIVVVQVVAASIFIPSAQDTERLARQYVAATAGRSTLAGSAEAGEATGKKTEEDVEEVEMGTFNITHFNPSTNTTLSIDFELFGAVLARDKAEFHKLLEKNKVRLREQVIMTLHAAESKDLSDAGLGLLKRQILEKTNRALGQPLLKEVLFSKFNFVER